ncbi:hypothetical protein [Campylobacter vicugnae]|uniref:HU family DNA-binding protein n=1 Tax=Campylobacter vicugnae TaxID=1660076 RepID=A0ABZ2E6L5_9BACT|nr:MULTISPECIES: hypothetical protein [unclassified Campylobacter]
MADIRNLSNRVYEKDSRVKYFLCRYEFQNIVKSIFEEIKQITLEEKDTLYIGNLGKFYTKNRKGISPFNKKPYDVTTLNFKLYKRYKIKK